MRIHFKNVTAPNNIYLAAQRDSNNQAIHWVMYVALVFDVFNVIVNKRIVFYG